MALINCDECGNEMSDKADTCPECGVPSNSGSMEISFTTSAIIIGAFLTLIVGIAIMGGNGGSDSSSGPDWAGAVTICQQFIKKRLVAPATAEFPWDGEDRTTRLSNKKFKVNSYVDAQNRMGAKIRKNFTCVVTHKSGNRWSLEKLNLSN